MLAASGSRPGQVSPGEDQGTPGGHHAPEHGQQGRADEAAAERGPDPSISLSLSLLWQPDFAPPTGRFSDGTNRNPLLSNGTFFYKQNTSILLASPRRRRAHRADPTPAVPRRAVACAQSYMSKGIRRQGIGSFARNSYVSRHGLSSYALTCALLMRAHEGAFAQASLPADSRARQRPHGSDK